MLQQPAPLLAARTVPNKRTLAYKHALLHPYAALRTHHPSTSEPACILIAAAFPSPWKYTASASSCKASPSRCCDASSFRRFSRIATACVCGWWVVGCTATHPPRHATPPHHIAPRAPPQPCTTKHSATLASTAESAQLCGIRQTPCTRVEGRCGRHYCSSAAQRSTAQHKPHALTLSLRARYTAEATTGFRCLRTCVCAARQKPSPFRRT